MSQKPLNHLAIIPDGNRRWAKLRGISSEKKIYEQGSDTTFEILKASFEAGIPFVTLWASSYSNLLERPKALVDAIELIFARMFHTLATHELTHKNEVRVEVLGEWRTILKPKTVAAMEESMRATKHYTKRHLTVLIGYDGQRERGAATIKLLSEPGYAIQNDDLSAAAALFRRHAWTGHLPDVDLVLRTGSWEDPHNSAGFLSLIAADSQYAFPPVLWPDLTPDMLCQIVADFAQRERRLGK